MKLKFLIAIIFLINVSYAYTNVSVVPAILVIDSLTRNGTIEISNQSNEVREFTIELKFGYQKYDSLGKQSIEYKDSLLESEFSIIPYIKLFPRKLIIPPKESQVVRVILSKVPEITNRTYWTRMITSSEPVVKQIDSSTILKADSGKIVVGFQTFIRMNGMVLYHNGNVTSAVDIDLISNYKDSVTLNLLFKVNKAGTSPFIGSIISHIYDVDNNLLLEQPERLSIFENCRYNIQIPSKVLKPGKLRVELEINNVRQYITEEQRIPFKTLKKTFYVDY